MKKVLVLAGLLFLGGTTAQATIVNEGHYGLNGSRYQNAQPITFKLHEVRYFVHTDGTLDFKVPKYIRERWNTAYGHSNHSTRYGKTTPSIRYDHLGRVVKIGKNDIYYNGYGQVKKIGQFYIGYRHNRVKSIGGIHVRYDNYGALLTLEGYLSPYRDDCPTCNAYGCSVDYYNLSDYRYVKHDSYKHGNRNHNNSYAYRDRSRSRSRGR